MADTYEVEFLMCDVGMPKHGLQAKDIVSYVKIIPNEGYAYIPVGEK